MLYNLAAIHITMVGMACASPVPLCCFAYGAGFHPCHSGHLRPVGNERHRILPRPHKRTGRQATSPAPWSASPRMTSTAHHRRCSGHLPHPRPLLIKTSSCRTTSTSYTWTVNGVRSVFQDIWKLDTDAGRSSTEPKSSAQRRMVRGQDEAVLRSGRRPRPLSPNGVLFTIIGVLSPKMMQEGQIIATGRSMHALSTMSDLAGYQVPGRNLVQLPGQLPAHRAESARHAGVRPSLPRVRSQRRTWQTS